MNQPIPQISMRQMCEHIVKAKIFDESVTAEQIFNYSPTGELFMVFEWYRIACDILKCNASQLHEQDQINMHSFLHVNQSPI